MNWNRILQSGQRPQRVHPAKAKELAAKAARTRKLVIAGAVSLVGVIALAIVLVTLLGGNNAPVGSTDPPERQKLNRVYELYQLYANQNHRPPANEAMFKEFIRGQPKTDRDQVGVGADVDGLLVSPRDGQKYVIRYGVAINPGAINRALAWEQTGKDGARLVLLHSGEVSECDERDFKTLQK